MTRTFNFALLCCLIFQTAGGADDDFRVKQSRIADVIEKIPAEKIKLFLYSLNPNDHRRYDRKFSENSDESFHWMPVLGHIEIASTQEKVNLLKAFSSGVRENDGMVANCFEPRHGIRIISETSTNDFVICFKCLSVEVYGFNSSHGFLTSSTPDATFNSLLDKYKIKKAD
jgi:hypothetical protein